MAIVFRTALAVSGADSGSPADANPAVSPVSSIAGSAAVLTLLPSSCSKKRRRGGYSKPSLAASCLLTTIWAEVCKGVALVSSVSSKGLLCNEEDFS